MVSTTRTLKSHRASSQSQMGRTTARDAQREAQHKAVREIKLSNMHERLDIACRAYAAHVYKAAKFTSRCGAHCSAARAGGPNQPEPPTLHAQPTSEKLADTAAPSSPISPGSTRSLATADDHERRVYHCCGSCWFERRAQAHLWLRIPRLHARHDEPRRRGCD